MFEITEGKITKAKKIVVYGPEGIGKSTFASKFPNPLFIDTEGSTGEMNVKRLPKPTSLTMLYEEIEHVKQTRPCGTLVIDTVDWAERMTIEHVCTNSNKKSITQFGYGEGFIQLEEETGRLLNRLSDVIDLGINVVLNAHTKINKFEQPDELGAYDRYELKLGNKTTAKTSSLVKEWADMVLFANYKTYSVAVDKEGKKHKAQGGQRVMYTTHHPCWDAKNRYGLAEELPFDYSSIAHLFNEQPVTVPISNPAINNSMQTEPAPYTVNTVPVAEMLTHNTETVQSVQASTVSQLPKALQDLMSANLVTEEEIRKVVSKKGYFPIGTPILNYGDEFINGVLIGAWPQVYGMIQSERDMQF